MLFVCGWWVGSPIFVQHPGAKCGAALALRGKKGVGKTIVGKVFGSLLGRHYALLTQARHITGQFNKHLTGLLLAHADEAFWAGDKQGEGVIKSLITAETMMAEFKGVDIVRVDNHVRLLVTGNADWLVAAGREERRFAVLDVGDTHMQDIPYFAALEKQMNEG